ncbi:uncharacterized protein EI90DRAFT_3054733, partial [Cantharellus anzutake]|uniref:uncharacterized protein n=1 Tax=Cantharellus anzutake TaxID=1750568 RepID=UPI001907309B
MTNGVERQARSLFSCWTLRSEFLNPPHDVGQDLPTSLEIPELVRGATDSAAAVRDLGSVLKVTDKTKTVVDFVDKTAKLHPYANIVWQVLSSVYQAVRGQIERDDTLCGLVVSMADLYSFVDAVD